MMKAKLFLAVLLFLSVPTSRSLAMGNPPPVPHVSALQTQISAELYSLDADLAAAAQKISLIGLTGDTPVDILQNLYDRHPSIVDNATVSLDGRLLLIEPYKYKSAEGQYIGDQAHFIQAKNTRQPVMSDMFKTVEGFWAISIIYPVVTTDGKTIGYVSSVFRPDALIRNVISPYISYYPSVEATAIDTDGHIVYDKDLLQVGKNTFTDPAYQSYASLLNLARQITAEAAGTGTYTFSTGLGNAPAEKSSEWSTISLHGVDWRLILSKNL